MDAHREAIWNRGNVREIMREARERFRARQPYGPGRIKMCAPLVDAHVQLASTHYSLIKRYKKFDPRAIWHAWRAAAHINTAVDLGLRNFDQADVCATVLSRVPWFLGGDLEKAHRIAKSALEYSAPAESAEMLPHTRALLSITLGEILYSMGRDDDAHMRYVDAWRLVSEILHESDVLMGKRQAIRVLKKIGFRYGTGRQNAHEDAIDALRRAVALAREVSKDQEVQILAECSRLGIKL